MVFYQGEITSELQEFALDAIRNIVTIEHAENLLNKVGADFYKFKNGRGVIGALAAIACPLDDKTYELLSYRIPENNGTPRRINHESVREMDKQTYPKTFDNLDQGYIAIEPHTPCPVLYGIRSENPEILVKAKSIVKDLEPVERSCVFLTNQHTDMHLQKVGRISDMEKYKCYIVEGKVKDKPNVIEGGHIIFSLEDTSGEIECAAYEPTKQFRDFVRELIPEDILRVYGGIGEGINNKGTLNIEKFELLKLADLLELKNPICQCGKRMKSAGTEKGFKCPNCGIKVRDEKKESNVPLGRFIQNLLRRPGLGRPGEESQPGGHEQAHRGDQVRIVKILVGIEDPSAQHGAQDPAHAPGGEDKSIIDAEILQPEVVFRGRGKDREVGPVVEADEHGGHEQGAVGVQASQEEHEDRLEYKNRKHGPGAPDLIRENPGDDPPAGIPHS